MEKQRELAEIFGLSLYEARVYLSLANEGPSMLSRLAKVSGLPRTAVYPPLQALLKKGFASLTLFGRRKYYEAVSPEHLKNILERRRVSLESVVSTIMSPKKISMPGEKLDVQFFPGKNGVKTAGGIFLDETRSKTWYSFENLEGVTSFVGIDFEKNYVSERVKKRIRSRMILSADTTSSTIKEFLEKDREQLRETIILSPYEYPFSSSVGATKGLVLLLSVEANPFALLIRNNSLAETFISIHRNIWERYRNQDRRAG